MKIIILGAGQVGTTLSENLASENNDITIVDKNSERLEPLQERLDIRTLVGQASHPNLLRRAGAEDADIIIAVTSSDESNMIACQVAHTLYQTPTKIARIRSLQYLAHEELFGSSAIPIDVLISPEQLVTNYIRRLIEYPDALQVLNFAHKKVRLVAVRAYYGGPLVGHALSSLSEHLPNANARVVAIYRGKSPILPTGSTIIEPDDEVFFLASNQDIRKVMAELRKLGQPNKRIMIAGGGNIGTRLAQALEEDFQVKIIDRNHSRVETLATLLNDTIVLHGDASDKSLLLDESIDSTDVFCSVTNSDEANIMSAILAKRLGAKKVMALINRAAYVDIVEEGDIDIAISPQQATIGSLLTHVRRADVVKVHSLRRGAAEAIEAIAHGDSETSFVVGKTIEEINLPEGATIGAIARGDEVIMAHHNITIETGDHVIIFLTDKRKVHEIEHLFQTGPSIF